MTDLSNLEHSSVSDHGNTDLPIGEGSYPNSDVSHPSSDESYYRPVLDESDIGCNNGSVIVRFYDRGPLRLVVVKEEDFHKSDCKILVYANKEYYDYLQLPDRVNHELPKVNKRSIGSFIKGLSLKKDSNIQAGDNDVSLWEIPKTLRVKKRNVVLTNHSIRTCKCNYHESSCAHNQHMKNCKSSSLQVWNGSPILMIKINGIFDDYEKAEKMIALLLDYLSDNLDTLPAHKSGTIPVLVYNHLWTSLGRIIERNDFTDSLSPSDFKKLQYGRLAFEANNDFIARPISWKSAIVYRHERKSVSDDKRFTDEYIVKYPVTGDFLNFNKYVSRMPVYENLTLSTHAKPILIDWYLDKVLNRVNSIAPKGTVVDRLVERFIDWERAFELGILGKSLNEILVFAEQANPWLEDVSLRLVIDRTHLFNSNDESFHGSLYTKSEWRLLKTLNMPIEESRYVKYAVLKLLNANTTDEIRTVALEYVFSYDPHVSHADIDKIVELSENHTEDVPFDFVLSVHGFNHE